MVWRKHGKIFEPRGDRWWSRTHAQCPVAELRPRERQVWVYYSTRDAEGRSRPGRLVLDAEDPTQVLDVRDEPLLDLGPPGSFDEFGVMPSSVVRVGERVYLYYTGWTLLRSVPFHNSVGLAISEDGGASFRRFSEGPLWDRSPSEPYFSGTPHVRRLADDTWVCWYLSCVGWLEVEGRFEPRYHLKVATSADGQAWDRRGAVAVDLESDEEGGLSSPTVLVKDGQFQMWFSRRKVRGYRTDPEASYRMGYAESGDGFTWRRQPEPGGLLASEDGWDAEMLVYPSVVEGPGRTWMFYNGNGFGRSGIGVASLEVDP